MTQEDKKAEVDAYLAEKDAMKRLKVEKIIAGQVRLQGAENIVPGLTGGLVGAVLVMFGARGEIGVPIVIVVVTLACVVGVDRWLGARRVNRQIAALKEYIDLRLAEIERAGGRAEER